MKEVEMKRLLKGFIVLEFMLIILMATVVPTDAGVVTDNSSFAR